MRYQFVDCRFELGNPGRGRELYLAGHIPGAPFLDVDEDLSDLTVEGQGRHPLPSARRFAEVAGRAGIEQGVYVVAYGSGGGAERLWWLLRHFGHDECAVLAGGIDAWLGALRAGEEEIEPATFVPAERGGDTIDGPELARRLDDFVLVDARIASRWRGEENPIDKVPGRIPGASTRPGTNRFASYRKERSSPTAGRASPRRSPSTASGSPAARRCSTPARGASGRRSTCPSSRARLRLLRPDPAGTAASRLGSSEWPAGCTAPAEESAASFAAPSRSRAGAGCPSSGCTARTT